MDGMKKPQVRPRRGSAHKVTTMKKREERVTQLDLAQSQQLQSEIAQPDRLQSDIAKLERTLRTRWNTLRMQLLRGIAVEPGPIRAFLKKSGDTQKLIVK